MDEEKYVPIGTTSSFSSNTEILASPISIQRDILDMKKVGLNEVGKDESVC